MTDGERAGLVSTIGDLGGKLIGSLPPVFLALILINGVFIGTVLWFLSDQMDSRTAIAGKIIDRCMAATADLPAIQARLDALERDIRKLEAK